MRTNVDKLSATIKRNLDSASVALPSWLEQLNIGCVTQIVALHEISNGRLRYFVQDPDRGDAKIAAMLSYAQLRISYWAVKGYIVVHSPICIEDETYRFDIHLDLTERGALALEALDQGFVWSTSSHCIDLDETYVYWASHFRWGSLTDKTLDRMIGFEHPDLARVRDQAIMYKMAANQEGDYWTLEPERAAQLFSD